MAIGASLLMGLGAALLYAIAARRDYFQDLEETKYQVFWSDLEELVDAGQRPAVISTTAPREGSNGDESPAGQGG